MSSSEETVYFLYGSETGNCESITKGLHHEAVTEKGYPTAECMTLNQAVTKKILDRQLGPKDAEPAGAAGKPKVCVVIVCSTTGEGEPPENAARFRRWLRNTKDVALVNTRFTVLALGDTNYNNFCSAGKFIDSKLVEFGGTRFYPRGEADDGVSLELVVGPWTEGLWAALASSPGGAAAVGPSVGNETYQTAGRQRVDMAVAMETAIVYANASQICATVALFLYERIIELGGAAELYPIQYFSPAKAKADTKIVLFVLCTDSDEHTLCEHCASCPREAPLGPFAQLLGGGALTTLGTEPGSTAALSPCAAATSKWLTDPSMRFYSAVCVAPRHESVSRAATLSNRVRALAASCKVERLSKRQPEEQASAVAVSEDDVATWAETVLDNLPGVTADESVIQAAVDYFFDSRVGAAFREAYMDDAGFLSAGAGGASGGGGSTTATSTNTAARRARRHQKHYHGQFANGSGGPVTADSRNSSVAGGRGCGGGGGGAREDADNTAAVSRSPSARAQRPTATAKPKESKVLNEYLLTPVVFLYSGGEYVSHVAHDMNAGAAAHHLRSSAADLTNFVLTGFPRRATFVFVVGGALTKALSKLLKALRAMVAANRDISGVRFAILGIDESTQNDKFNVCALELESLLLSLKASKIHCTGLADMDKPDGLAPVLKAWSMNLWSAILHPMTSVAYLDAASLNVAAGRPMGGGGGGETNSSLRESGSGDGDLGGGGGGGAAALLAAADGEPGNPETRLGALLPSSSRDGPGRGHDLSTTSSGVVAATPLFPWDSVPLNSDNAQATPLVCLYSSYGMAKTMALHAVSSARALGFPASLLSFSQFDKVDFAATPNLILFCETGPDGRSSGGKRFRKYLLNPSHPPDHFSYVRFAVLGLGPSPGDVIHPAFMWSNMLCRLQANRVFPVVIMPSLSQLHSLGIPWSECVFATLALTLPRDPDTAGAAAGRQESALATGPDGTTDLVPQPSSPPLKKMTVLFLYGSATGLAESIARDFHDIALEKGYASRITALNYYERMNFVSADNVVVVCSTVGTNPGGYPDNAHRFARYIHRKSQPTNLLNGSNTRYAVLGLDNGFSEARDAEGNALGSGDEAGNTTASQQQQQQGGQPFCKPARKTDRRLEELGGCRLCPLRCVNVSMVLAEPVEAWRAELFGALSAREAAVVRATESPVTDRPGALSPALNGAGSPALSVSGSDGRRNSAPSLSLSASARPALASKAMIAYASPPNSAVPEIAAHLEKLIHESTGLSVLVQPMNALTQTEWRNDYHTIILVVASNDDGDFPLNGLSFLRLLRHKNNPIDLYARVRYTVLAISDTNERRFYVGRNLDRRLEELGGTRFYARGEAVDSFSLDRTVERWIGGLLSALTTIYEDAREMSEANTSNVASPLNAAPPRNGAVTGGGGDAGGASGLPFVRAGSTQVDSSQVSISAYRGSTTAMSNAAVSDCAGMADVSEGVIHSWMRLTSDAVEEPVILINLTVSPETTHWEPGQTVAVMPVNDPSTVETLLERLRTRSDEPFQPLSVAGPETSSYPNAPLYGSVDFPVSCGTVLLRYASLRLTRANRTLFTLLGKNATSEAEKEVIRDLTAKLATAATAGGVPVTLLEVLQDLPDIAVPFRHIVEHLSVLQPRVYSIASSSAADSTTLSLCFKVLQHGLCTNWMYDLCQWTAADSLSGGGNSPTRGRHNELVVAQRRAAIPFAVRPVSEFRMPRDALIPLILIGPGTGVSPFRAFLQERAAWLSKTRGPSGVEGPEGGGSAGGGVPHGVIDLYFGCRRAQDDFLFSCELESFERAGVLSSLSLACSREPSSGAFWYGGCYVQDRLFEGGVGIAELLTQRGARIYVCGDAESMAKEVHQCLIEIVQQHLRVSRADAAEYMDGMMRTGRYVRDVWTDTPI